MRNTKPHYYRGYMIKKPEGSKFWNIYEPDGKGYYNVLFAIGFTNTIKEAKGVIDIEIDGISITAPAF